MDKDQEARLCFEKLEQIKLERELFHIDEGMKLQRLRKYQQAVLCFDRVIQINAENALYYCLRGRILRSLERQQDAFSDLKKAQEIIKSGGSLIPQTDHLASILDLILELQKDNEIAEKVFE